jgi:hypothetical protein
MKVIASRYWSKAFPVFYVANLKGRVGDWGYTTQRAQAIPLSPYWQRRFAADCLVCGVLATFIAAE